MIHRLSALLCDATSLVENDLDMLCVVVVGKKMDVEEDRKGIGKRRRKTRHY